MAATEDLKFSARQSVRVRLPPPAQRVVSSEVEHLVYTERVRGSNPLPPTTLAFQDLNYYTSE